MVSKWNQKPHLCIYPIRCSEKSSWQCLMIGCLHWLGDHRLKGIWCSDRQPQRPAEQVVHWCSPHEACFCIFLQKNQSRARSGWRFLYLLFPPHFRATWASLTPSLNSSLHCWERPSLHEAAYCKLWTLYVGRPPPTPRSDPYWQGEVLLVLPHLNKIALWIKVWSMKYGGKMLWNSFDCPPVVWQIAWVGGSFELNTRVLHRPAVSASPPVPLGL